MPAKPAPVPVGRPARRRRYVRRASSGAPLRRRSRGRRRLRLRLRKRPLRSLHGSAAADEAAGRTMMFQTGNLKTAPVASKKPAPPASSPWCSANLQPDTSAISRRPVPGRRRHLPSSRPPRSPVAGDARSTLTFGPPRAAPSSPPPVAVPPPSAQRRFPKGSRARSRPFPPCLRAGTFAAGAGQKPVRRAQNPHKRRPERSARGGGRARKRMKPRRTGHLPTRRRRRAAHRRGGRARALVGDRRRVGRIRKLPRRPPPPAEVEALATAQSTRTRTRWPRSPSAESKARTRSKWAGPRVRFRRRSARSPASSPVADAFNEQAAQLADRSADDTPPAQLQAQAKAKLKSAFDRLAPALEGEQGSRRICNSRCGLLRAQRLPSSMNRYLANVKDDPRAALILGMAAAQEEDGDRRQFHCLKAALATSRGREGELPARGRAPRAKDEAAARADLQETSGSLRARAGQRRCWSRSDRQARGPEVVTRIADDIRKKPSTARTSTSRARTRGLRRLHTRR